MKTLQDFQRARDHVLELPLNDPSNHPCARAWILKAINRGDKIYRFYQAQHEPIEDHIVSRLPAFASTGYPLMVHDLGLLRTVCLRAYAYSSAWKIEPCCVGAARSCH